MDVGEDLVVVCPRRTGEVNSRRGFGKEFREKESTKMDGASSRDGL